jgi:hypothetical protein
MKTECDSAVQFSICGGELFRIAQILGRALDNPKPEPARIIKYDMLRCPLCQSAYLEPADD